MVRLRKHLMASLHRHRQSRTVPHLLNLGILPTDDEPASGVKQKSMSKFVCTIEAEVKRIMNYPTKLQAASWACLFVVVASVCIQVQCVGFVVWAGGVGPAPSRQLAN